MATLFCNSVNIGTGSVEFLAESFASFNYEPSLFDMAVWAITNKGEVGWVQNNDVYLMKKD